MFPCSSKGLYSPKLSFVPCTSLRRRPGRNRRWEDPRPEVLGPQRNRVWEKSKPEGTQAWEAPGPARDWSLGGTGSGRNLGLGGTGSGRDRVWEEPEVGGTWAWEDPAREKPTAVRVVERESDRPFNPNKSVSGATGTCRSRHWRSTKKCLPSASRGVLRTVRWEE